MLLSTRQACERLGIGRGKLFKLVKLGELTDQGETLPGGKRHQLKFQAKDVEAYRKQARNGHGNGHAPIEQARVVATPVELHPPVVPVVRRPDVMVAPIRQRLDAIDRKLQSLETVLLEVVRLWS